MYSPDAINAAMGAQRLTNEKVAEKAGVAPKTVSAIRNGFPGVTLPTLSRIANAVGLDVVIQFTPKVEQSQVEEPAAA
jgi:transcriptional regulator with XRE-family HTH domain